MRSNSRQCFAGVTAEEREAYESDLTTLSQAGTLQDMDRTFLVRRENTTVVIREVAPESCAYTFSKVDAWAHAKCLAMPAPKSQDPKAKLPAQIVFQGLDGMSTVVQTEARK